ncbi:hypothetical protein M7I_1591 [Glarea lozoyensis 74030]|uniref:Uncharacterized protein n=1 Tax=Glarea lozoyensis (strain ATCC 74030 / MF5533) TaxID=1104152 RepID=H0EGH5_GLAL7|nr:hypothetical protein M7I_1591 [Glarea lozoyensis 74030]
MLKETNEVGMVESVSNVGHVARAGIVVWGRALGGNE